MSTSSSDSMSIASSDSERVFEVDFSARNESDSKISKNPHVSCIYEVQLSRDARCIFTTDYNRTFSVYAIVSDILDGGSLRSLTPYAQSTSSDPIWAFAVNPYFDINNSETTTVLISRRDQYISLHNALWDLTQDPDIETEQAETKNPVNISSKMASYKLIDGLTEAVTAPLSLAWDHGGGFFYAGHENTISIFDMTNTNGPISRIRTIPSANSKLKGGGRGFKGQISALSLCPASSTTNAHLIAAGARTRHIGLYDVNTSQEITSFSLPGSICGRKLHNHDLQNMMGDGVTSLKWSPDGTYLYIAERNSSAVLIYDVRNFSFALGHCAGRQAFSKQKMGIDVWAPMDQFGDYTGSHEVWAGGTDGKVRVWKNPHKGEGAVQADEVMDVGEGSVGSVLVHPYGSVAVMARGAIQVGNEGRGMHRGDVRTPSIKEWGCLDILGLGSY